MKTDLKQSIQRLRSLARTRDRTAVRKELQNERPEDFAPVLQRLPAEEGVALLKQLTSAQAADVLLELPSTTAREYLAELDDRTLAHYLDILPMDDALDLRDVIGEERYDALLEVIPTEDAKEIRRLLAYPERSVGRIMTEKYFWVAPEATMADVLADIRRSPADKYEMVNDVYVLSPEKRLLGVFSLRRAIRAKPEALAAEVMNPDVVTCRATEPAEECARRMSKYGFYALPVLNDEGLMVGIFTGDDAQEILQDADTEDALKFGGVTGDAEAYLSLNPFQLFRRRFVWLLALFFAETLTGIVMRRYGRGGGELQMSDLMFFIPLLIGAGGNSGSQTTTTVIRALAVGELKTSDVFNVMGKELLTALMIGSALGIAGYARALGWGTPANVALVVGLSLPVIVIWATTIGALLPIGAKRLGIDPAVMSAPFMSTFVDATGLVIYFEIARQVL